MSRFWSNHSMFLPYFSYVSTIVVYHTVEHFYTAKLGQVAVRIKNSTQDGLEQWMSGIVSTVWPRLPGERQWSFAGMSGEFPQEVPYKVDLSPGPPNFVFVHWDNHTLIRRDGLQPQDRVKGISKRLEIRTCEDGSVEQFDHLTERHKPVPRRPMVDPKDMEVSDSDSD